MTDTLRGIALMTLSMAGFALSDMFIKLASARLPLGQILMVLGAGGALIFVSLARRQGTALWTADAWHPAVMGRNLAEITGTLGFTTALALTTISSASAILQATPLAVTLGAAIFLKEAVGWRRWSAVFLGFAGVLIILRPGTGEFDANSLFAVLGVLGLAARDVLTRMVPRRITTPQLASYAFLWLIPTGAAVLVAQGEVGTADLRTNLYLVAMVICAALANFAITVSLRIAEVSVVSPFRYTRLVFGLIIGVAIFGERLDTAMLLGSALVIVAGLYTLGRESRLHSPKPPR